MPPPNIHLKNTTPSPWVITHVPRIKPGGRVLDVACGGGRHVRALLGQGYKVTALDQDTTPLADLAEQVEIITADLEGGVPWPLAGRLFDGIIVTNYLYRPLFTDLLNALAPGGVLIYETFMIGNEQYGRPRNPDHLLKKNELLNLVGDRLILKAFEQGYRDQPKPAMVQSYCGLAR